MKELLSVDLIADVAMNRIRLPTCNVKRGQMVSLRLKDEKIDDKIADAIKRLLKLESWISHFSTQ